MYCRCPARTHGYDLIFKSETRPWRQPCCCAVLSPVASCEVFVESWSFHTFVFTFPHPSSARSCHELADSGINTGTDPFRSHRHSNDFHVQRHFTSTLRPCWARRHTVIIVLTTSLARHHQLLTLHFQWHIINLHARTDPVEPLHVHVLATENHGNQIDLSCFDHSPVVQIASSWAWQRCLDQFDTLVIQQLDSVMTTNSSVLTLCHSSHSDS